MNPLGLRTDQIGILVPDLERAAAEYAAAYGLERWRAWTYGPEFVPELVYMGEPDEFSMLLALTDTKPQIELIQPLSGRSIYSDWIEQRGYGLHHLGSVVAELAPAAARMRAAGFEQIQSGAGYGAGGDGGFAYFDATATLGLIVELIEVPKLRRDPHRIWADGRWEG